MSGTGTYGRGPSRHSDCLDALNPCFMQREGEQFSSEAFIVYFSVINTGFIGKVDFRLP